MVKAVEQGAIVKLFYRGFLGLKEPVCRGVYSSKSFENLACNIHMDKAILVLAPGHFDKQRENIEVMLTNYSKNKKMPYDFFRNGNNSRMYAEKLLRSKKNAYGLKK